MRTRRLLVPGLSQCGRAAVTTQIQTLSLVAVFSAEMIQIVPLIHFPCFYIDNQREKSVFFASILVFARIDASATSWGNDMPAHGD